MSFPKIGIICAVSEMGVFGYKDPQKYDFEMPWRCEEDMDHFRTKTMGHTVVMGGTTYGSLPPDYKPLPGRQNVVITRRKQSDFPTDVLALKSLESLFDWMQATSPEKVFLIGGKSLIKGFLYSEDDWTRYLSGIHLSIIYGTNLIAGEEGVALSQEVRDQYVIFDELLKLETMLGPRILNIRRFVADIQQKK